MNKTVYNLSVVTGLALTGTGIGIEFGAGYGLATTGLLLIGLTINAARLVVASAAREG